MPCEGASDERDDESDHCNDDRRVRVFGGAEDGPARQGVSCLEMFNVLLRDEPQGGRRGEPPPEHPELAAESAGTRSERAFAGIERTGDDPKAMQLPNGEPKQADPCREDHRDRLSPRRPVPRTGEGIVVPAAIGQQEHEVVGDDERDERHHEGHDQPSQTRHGRELYGNRGSRPHSYAYGRCPRRQRSARGSRRVSAGQFAVARSSGGPTSPGRLRLTHLNGGHASAGLEAIAGAFRSEGRV